MSVQLKSLLGVTPSINKSWTSETAQLGSSLSLREIMEQEKKIISQSQSQDHPKPASGSWASKAAIIGSGNAVLSNSNPIKYNNNTSLQKINLKDDSNHVNNPQVLQNEQKVESSLNDPTFMQKDLKEWCEIHLKRINGTTDLTLIQFFLKN